MENRIYGYAQACTKEQNLDQQILALQEYGVEKRNIIIDKESEKNLYRPGYQTLVQTLLRPGDTLVIPSLDRLSHNTYHIKKKLEHLQVHKIRLNVLDLPTTLLDFPKEQEWVLDMIHNILMEVLDTIAEQERNTIRQRQAEGIASAKARGVRLGRPPIEKPENWEHVMKEWKTGQITAVKAMALTHTTKSTFYKLAKHS